ncbi:annexin A13-like [Haemaphysalis longicornis]
MPFLFPESPQAHREEGVPLDESRARHDAQDRLQDNYQSLSFPRGCPQKLLEAGVLRWGTDVSIFNCIIAGQSYEQLRLVFREYNALANHTIMEAITREMSGDIKRGFLAIIKCVYNTSFYFAEEIYNALKGIGTNNKVLKRIVVSRCEIDLELIKQEYLSKYKIPLATAIQKDTSGSYRKALLAIVNGN